MRDAGSVIRPSTPGSQRQGLVPVRFRLLFSILVSVALACDAGESPSGSAARPAPPPVTVDPTPGPAPAPLHPDAPLWGELEPGPYAVGFELRVLEDPARRAPPGDPGNPSDPTSESSPRPILWALWYPTSAPSGEPLRWMDYTRPPGGDEAGAVRGFAERLHQHSLGVIAEIAFRRSALPGQDNWLMLEADQIARLQRDLQTPVPSYRDAPPTDLRHPALIYHPGAGGNFEENSVLFEYLASHGYLVLSSAYSSDARLNPSTEWTHYTDSFADLQFLWRALASRPDVDPSKIGLIGHSLGAQTMYSYALAHRGAAALVSLDTTFENLPIDERNDPTDALHYREPGRLQIPVANFYANPTPNFSFIESLIGAERSLVGVPDFGHEDFTSHGGAIRARLEADAAEAAGQPETKAEAERIFRDYQAVCVEVRGFLDSTLLGRAVVVSGANFERRTLPRSEAIDTSVERLVVALRSAGPSGVATLLEEGCTSQGCMDLLARALEELSFDRSPELARAILAAVRQRGTDGPSNFEIDSIGARLSIREGDWAGAVESLERALAQLEAKPYPHPLLHAYFVRNTTTQLERARARATGSTGTTP